VLARKTVIGTLGAPLAGNVTTSGSQLFSDDGELGVTPTTLTSINANVTFERTLNGASALTVLAPGTTTFGGAVGNTVPLLSLTTDYQAGLGEENGHWHAWRATGWKRDDPGLPAVPR